MLPVVLKIHFKILLWVYKALAVLAPQYTSGMLSVYNLDRRQKSPPCTVPWAYSKSASRHPTDSVGHLGALEEVSDFRMSQLLWEPVISDWYGQKTGHFWTFTSSHLGFEIKVIHQLTVAHFSAIDLSQTSLMVSKQILLRGWTSPLELPFQE